MQGVRNGFPPMAQRQSSQFVFRAFVIDSTSTTSTTAYYDITRIFLPRFSR